MSRMASSMTSISVLLRRSTLLGKLNTASQECGTIYSTKTSTRGTTVPRVHLAQCFEIRAHHDRRSFAGGVFLVGEAFDLEAVLLKAGHRPPLTRIVSPQTVETFAGHPADNAL